MIMFMFTAPHAEEQTQKEAPEEVVDKEFEYERYYGTSNGLKHRSTDDDIYDEHVHKVDYY